MVKILNLKINDEFLLNFIFIFFYFLNVHAQNVYPEYADALHF